MFGKVDVSEKKTVCLVSGGNLGKPQGIPFVIECMKKLAGHPEAFFLIVGDGTDSELLQEEGIEETDAFVAITGIDEANILMGMRVAREYGDGCKVVAKINRRSLVELVSAESMIDSVVSAATVGVGVVITSLGSVFSSLTTRLLEAVS